MMILRGNSGLFYSSLTLKRCLLFTQSFNTVHCVRQNTNLNRPSYFFFPEEYAKLVSKRWV